MNKIIILLLSIANTKQFDLETCRYPIGIETGKIFDSAFSSSSHAREDTIASKARIRSKTDGWCPLNKISSTTYEYLQIDLVNLTVITLIEIQGKFSLKSNDEFADAFRIEYRRDKNLKWIKYKDFSGQEILSGNVNNYIPTIRDIRPSIIARQIRIIPIVIGTRSKYICMRLELYGCSYQDGLISYSIPQGDKRGYDIQFFDEIYDGENENGILKNGLGQLTDGIIAHDDNLLIDNEWIGWKRRTSDLNLIFYFETIRNITSIRIHTSNFFLHDIYLFQSLNITNCKHQQIDLIIPNDYMNISSRFIHLDLTKEKNFLTDCLNIKLNFNNRSKWILISEIQFDSIPFIEKHSVIYYRYWLFIVLIFLLLFIFFINTKHHFKILSTDSYHHLIISTKSINSSEFNPSDIQGPCGNSIYECLFPLNESVLIPCVNDKQLIIGESYSTQIFRGYLYHKPILIKMLKTNDKNQLELFHKEHELLNQLNHPNLVQFYGYTIEQNYALIEHTDLGDLYTYLLTSQNLSKNIRLHLMMQLSNALYYLESHYIIHRDIAARNCLIYSNYKIKLTNSAIASDEFQSHYYNIDQIRLPIRWMAPECISNNQFTAQSDTWAFGITFWEVMTNCLTLPYSLLNDGEVYQRLIAAKGLHLSKPECLNKELIDLMLQCWRPCNERPTFQKIYNFINNHLYGIKIV